MPTSIFDALGGDAAVAAAVDGLYDRLIPDPLTGPYFDGVSLPDLKKHLRMFLAAALGGPEIYRGRDMRSAHAGLGITPAAWDRTVHHVVGVLADLGVEPALAARVVASLAPLRDRIVTSSEPAEAIAA
jgi:hemoglobin